MTVSIITPVWNRADMTFNFLNQHYRLFAHRDDIEYIIINNGSTDGTPAVLETFAEKMPLKIITQPDNIGFGPANNLGAQQVDGDVLIFVNNDVRLMGDYVSPLVDTLERNPGAIVGKELLDYDTGWNVFDGELIAYIHGWNMAMHKATFDFLGGFDERFVPGDYEDIDLCYTATDRGLSLIGLSALPIHHLSGQTARQLPDRRAMTERHRALFAQKWGFNGYET